MSFVSRFAVSLKAKRLSKLEINDRIDEGNAKIRVYKDTIKKLQDSIKTTDNVDKKKQFRESIKTNKDRIANTQKQIREYKVKLQNAETN